MEDDRSRIIAFISRNGQFDGGIGLEDRTAHQALAVRGSIYLDALCREAAVQGDAVLAALAGNIPSRLNLAARNAVAALRADTDRKPLALPLVLEEDLTFVRTFVLRYFERNLARVARVADRNPLVEHIIANRGPHGNARTRPIAFEEDSERLAVRMDLLVQRRVDSGSSVDVLQRTRPNPVVTLRQQLLVVERPSDAHPVDVMTVAQHVEVRGDILAQKNVVVQTLGRIRTLVRLDARIGSHRRGVVRALVLLPQDRGNLTPPVVAHIPRVGHRAAARTHRRETAAFAIAVPEVRSIARSGITL